jgi:galactose mutarotase-like enzyme
MRDQGWHDKISNSVQLGGVETSILDNGAGKGTRIAWINTGSGLRYKVVIDRAMDIAEAFYNQHSLAWINHAGVTPPEPISLKGTDWLRTFGGGLVTTCGLYHFGPPENDEHGERALHGLISNQPAEIESIVQPDPVNGRMEMSITGRIKETKLFGPRFEMRRTLSCTLGEPAIRIHDEVVNTGNAPTPHMILYHCNFGWPIVDEGTEILWRGDWKSGGREGDDHIFRDGNDFRVCPAPMREHAGTGEAVAFIDPETDSSGRCECGFHNARLGIGLALRFNKTQLPCLTNWQHWGKGEYVTGLEPGTNPPSGQAKAREEKNLIILQPGEKKTYDVELEVLDTKDRIREFLKKYKS